MAEGSQSAGTPGSSTSKTPAAKDKECPFCHQAFTSSSLGRHLDLYIRDKNPKAPDGIHDVEEIRALRGNITRRKVRNSSRREESTPSSSKATPLRDQRSPLLAENHTNGQHVDGEPFKTFVNKVNWQATGVINDLPPTPRNDPTIWTIGTKNTAKAQIKEESAPVYDSIKNIDRGQAAELALKEVLETVKAARYGAPSGRALTW